MKTKLIIISVLVVVLVACLCVPVFAYADYSDIVSNQNSIVNFNQLLHNNAARENVSAGLTFSYVGNGVVHITGSYSNNYDTTLRFYANPYSFDMISGHYYYIYVGNVDSVNYRLMDSTGDYIVQSLSSRGTIYYSSSNRAMYIGASFVVGNSYDLYASSYVIDLTQMFGSNEPDIEQANSIFVSDYYAYNTGTAMSLSDINSYAHGVQDTLDSFVVTFNADIIGSLGYAYNYDGLNSDFSYNSEYRAYYFRNFFALPVGSIPSNSQIEIYTQFLNVSGGTLYYQVYYMFNNSLVLASSELIQYQTYEDYDSQYSAINVFSIPYVVDTLYFCVSTNSATYTENISMYALKSEMTFKTLDVSTLVSTSFARGGEYYKTYYSEGHDGYNSIFNVGYTNGLNDNNPYTFGYLMSSVIESPLNAVLSIFNFDFLGVNFKNIITLILTLCIIIAIVRLFMGGN